jgi:phosphatidylserine/phosphatidylglycerophosphate/cardiolipin synthase-like enzyme
MVKVPFRPETGLLHPGETCWRVEAADRVAMLVDSSAYFTAALTAMRRARRSIFLLGWGFDPRTRLRPDPSGEEHGPDEIGALLRRLSDERPDLDIHILIWKSALPISASQHFFPHRARKWFEGTRINFALDASVPFGACHHQKVLIIDDRLAFCGGGDFGVDRWDSAAHLDADKRRIMPGGMEHQPRHEVMMMVDGDAARALGDLARERWRTAQECKTLPAPREGESVPGDPWPPHVAPRFTGARVAIARTLPRWRDRLETRETETLHLKAIAKARKTIYLENQYFTSLIVGEALAERLLEADGPEVVIVSTLHSPSYFDRFTMDRTRWRLFERLKAADRHGRLHVYCPFTEEGHAIIVHSKVTIIDDRLLRAGSTNLNHRSAGFDTECDLALEATTPEAEAAIRSFRTHELGHFLGIGAAAVQAAIDQHGAVGRAIDAIIQSPANAHRLRPLPRVEMGPIQRVVSAYHLGDPVYPKDSWRPLLRRQTLKPYDEALNAMATEGAVIASLVPPDEPPSVELEVHHQGEMVGSQPGQGA